MEFDFNEDSSLGVTAVHHSHGTYWLTSTNQLSDDVQITYTELVRARAKRHNLSVNKIKVCAAPMAACHVVRSSAFFVDYFGFGAILAKLFTRCRSE